MTAGRQTAIGAFVLGGIVLALVAIFLFGNFRFFNRVDRAVIVFQDSISGLSIGAPVTFRGVRVGSVDGISLVFNTQNHTAYIPVTVSLEPDRVQVTQNHDGGTLGLSDFVKRGLRAELNTQSFVTGQANINLDFDPSMPPVFHPGVSSLPEIPTRQSTIQRVTEQLSELHLRELTDNAQATLASLRTLSASLSTELPPLIHSLQSSSDRSGKALDTATQAIANLQARMDVTLAHVDRLMTDGDRELKARSGDMHAFLASSRQTMAQAQALVSNLNGLTGARGQARVNLEATLRDLAAATAALRGFASDIEQNPQLLLTGRKP
ncbi:MAG TPA: MlaD family protein [Stellaceae bacterium]|jgi:paraquat-inducible protein B|nr:MlaD family protein [Stellaceae bacterium]